MLQINLDKLQVQLTNNASGLNWGKNLQVSTRAIVKTNQGCGTVGGDGNIIPAAINAVNDADFLDSLLPQTPQNSQPESDQEPKPQSK